jgi:hypothetical protein
MTLSIQISFSQCMYTLNVNVSKPNPMGEALTGLHKMQSQIECKSKGI